MSDDVRERAKKLEALFPKILQTLYWPRGQDPLRDLPVGQVRVMRLLFATPMSHSAMSDELGISVSAVTQVANRLESMGLVSRVESATDRRVKLLKLTSYGEQCMEERQEQRVQRASAVLGTMTDSAQEQLLTVLTDFLEESSKVKKQLGVLPSATENDEAIA